MHVKDDGPAANTPKIVRKRVASLKPSPENLQIYRHPDNDPEIDRIAAGLEKSAAENLPCDPLIITLDNYIVSGHRRHAAMKRNGTVWVTCQVIPRRRDSFTDDEWIALLRRYNDQRQKTIAEQVREQLLDIDPDEAYRNLRNHRRQSICAAERNGTSATIIEGRKRRRTIGPSKAEHVKYIKKVIFEDRRDYWPLSDRAVHYPLLNYNFVRGLSKEKVNGVRQKLWYLNNLNSYHATCRLLTTLRLNGIIPWEAITDGTRPVEDFLFFDNAGQFVQQEVDGLFQGYRRNLLQSQPNYIELLVEKNTVFDMALRITEKYGLPTRSARGFASIDLWHKVYERYRESGKERLILIVLSDYDPEGERIVQVAGQTLHDSFGVEESHLKIYKAGVTPEQIARYNLPSANFAKEKSKNYKWFLERTNGNAAVYELESLNPEDMMHDLDNTIRSVIDIDFYNREVAAEREEAAYLRASRRTVQKTLQGLV